ncbi:MAG: hypothetical protein KJ645_04545, partial [Planctomycetes bacterium]|nr:hypothetical protein [Planctomycetota bacterium]
PDCTGLVPLVVLVSASLLAAMPWKHRLAMAALLGTAVLVFNELRIMTFFLIKTVNERAADLFHDLFIPLFLFVIIGGLWLKWLQQETAERGTDIPINEERAVRGNVLGVWERLSLGLVISLVVLLLADLLLKGSGILEHCRKIGPISEYLSVLCLGLIGWLGVVILFWKRKRNPAALLVGAFTGVHVALLGRLIVNSSLCASCVAAAVLSLLVFSTLMAQGHRRFLSFAALVIGIGVTQGLYFIWRF